MVRNQWETALLRVLGWLGRGWGQGRSPWLLPKWPVNTTACFHCLGIGQLTPGAVGLSVTSPLPTCPPEWYTWPWRSTSWP